jgi:hypothetical protein
MRRVMRGGMDTRIGDLHRRSENIGQNLTENQNNKLTGHAAARQSM